MLDVVGISDVFSFVTGAAAGTVGTLAAAYAYSKRAAIAALFKRAEATANSELTAIRAALVNLEDRAQQGFGHMASATRTVQADLTAVKNVVADVGARIEKLEHAVFGEPTGAPVQPAPAANVSIGLQAMQTSGGIGTLAQTHGIGAGLNPAAPATA